MAYLDVAYALSSLQDVNNWLGRSAYAGDALANCEYQEVRISSVAMSRDEILANYTLGPNKSAATVTMNADDAIGTTSLNVAGHWSDGLAPSAVKTYETDRFRLRTPADGTSRTFAGQSLTVDGGSITWKGTSSSTLTVNDLTVAGDCELVNAGSGTLTLTAANTMSGAVTVSGGTLTCDSGADVGVSTVTLVGGALANLGASAACGSWRFDNAGDVLAVTDNSTVSAVNVKFANGGAIDVAAG